VPQRVCRGDPSKAATNDHDALLLPSRPPPPKGGMAIGE
jgi:hypothetical protein